jgi:hypothetical protein
MKRGGGYGDWLRSHFEAKSAGKPPPTRLKNPVVSGPHRLGDSGYSFTLKQDREIPGMLGVVWSPRVPPAGVVDAHYDAYQRVMADVLPAVAANMPTGGLETWA